MKRDRLNDEYLELLEKQRLYFKTVKDLKEVTATSILYYYFFMLNIVLNCVLR